MLLRLRYYPEYSDETSDQTPMIKTANWQSVNDDSYVEFDINDVSGASEMEMSTTGSRVIDTSHFSNNVDNKLDIIERELVLTCGVENSTAALTKRDVILLTAQRIGGSGSENINASLIWSQFD